MSDMHHRNVVLLFEVMSDPEYDGLFLVLEHLCGTQRASLSTLGVYMVWFVVAVCLLCSCWLAFNTPLPNHYASFAFYFPTGCPSK